MHIKVINFRGYSVLQVFEKYTKISLRNICLNFLSKRINPRENFVEVLFGVMLVLN